MAIVISVELDDDATAALMVLEADGMSRSETIGQALIDQARRPRTRPLVAEEVAALEADDVDREEMRSIAAVMASLRDPR